MSRSGYVDDYDESGRLNLYRANVWRATVGKRGQSLLRDMAAALDAMPVKELIANELMRDESHVCALGAVAVARKMEIKPSFDYEDGGAVGRAFGIARALACEIAYENDEQGPRMETPAQRWTRMRAWVAAQIKGERTGAST